jgi:hypothetical protein
MTPEQIKRKYQDLLNSEILLAPEIADFIEATPADERTEQDTLWLQRWRADLAARRKRATISRTVRRQCRKHRRSHPVKLTR